MGKPYRGAGQRPASSFKFQPTRASRMAEAIACATMNPRIDPASFERSYGYKLADVLARIEAERRARGDGR